MPANKPKTTQSHQWKIGPSTFTASPELGAKLLSWDIQLPNSSRNILTQCSILFPFNGSTFHKNTENTWKTSGNTLHMPKNGFAQNAAFKTLSLDNSGFSSELIITPESQDSYPFNYSLQVHYQFTDLAINITLELTNNDNIPIPWCPGHLLNFTLPWHNNLSSNDYQIHIPAKKAFHPQSTGKLTRHKDALDTTSISDPSLQNRLHTHLKSNSIHFGPKSGDENIYITLDNDSPPTPWTSISTYSNSSSLSLTPSMGPPNSLELKKGLHTIQPNNSASYHIQISLF